MSIRSLLALTSALFLFMVAAPCAQAVIVIGNLPPPNDGGPSTDLNGTTQKAFVFTMGGTAYAVDNAVLRLNNYSTTAGDAAVLSLYLDNGSGTSPGAIIGSFTAPASTSDANANFVFLPVGTITLAAGSTYWLLADASAGTYTWPSSQPGVTPTGVGATFNFARASTNNGTSYSNSTVNNSFQLNGTVVPEPTSSLLLLGGTGMLALSRYRRGRRVLKA